jgi:hypothetical protein
MAFIRDVGLFSLVVLLFPLWMVLGLAGLLFIVGRHLYWWARGNSTAISSHRRSRALGNERRAFWSRGRLASAPRAMTADRKPIVPVGVVGVEAVSASNR